MQIVTFAQIRRVVAASVLIALASALSGCSSFNVPSFEPGDLFDFLDTKKKLPGDRRAVFPEGVPGLEQGVPKDLYRGAQASTANQPPPIEPPPAVEPPPRQKRTASRPARQAPPQPEPDPDSATAADEEGVAAAPPAPPPPRRRAAQRQQAPAAEPAPAQQPSAFPAPLPSGTFAR